MQSDRLIRKLLTAAAVVEGIYCALTLILCSAANVLTSGKAGQFFGGFYGSDDIKLGFPVPLAAQALIITAAFFGVWNVLRIAADPQKYSGAGGILLIVLYLAGGGSNTLVSLIVSRFYAAKFGTAYLSKFTVFRGNIITPVSVLHSAAVIMLFIVLGMEWYRAALIREQTAMQTNAYQNTNNYNVKER